jgi:hypothetical protein
MVLDVGKDIHKLKEFCSRPENMVIPHDYGANGDFTLMSKDLWHQLQGLSTPRGDMIAGIDIWQVQRAQQLGKPKHLYPFKIYHIEHPGRPQGSSFGVTITSETWGFPDEQFEEVLGEEK